jgi:hypothetical protein
MLEVVEQQHELALAQKGTEIVACADRLRDLAGDKARVGKRAQWDPEDAVADTADELGGYLKRQACLARSTRPGDRDKARTFEQIDELAELSLASEQRTCRQGEVRLVERPERRELAVAELKEAFGLDQVFQPVDAKIAEQSFGGEEIARRLRQDDLAAVRSRGDPRRAVHVETDVALRGHQRLTRVNAHANENRAVAQFVANLVRGGHGIGRAHEGRKEGVTLCVHLDSCVSRESLADDVAVGAEDVRVRGAMFL